MGIVLTWAIVDSGCGAGSSSPTPTQPTAATAVVQVTASPQPIVPAVCPPSHCGPLAGQLEIEATLTIRETAGVAATVTRIALTLRRRSDNAAIASTDAAPPGGARISAGGSLTVPIAMHFDATAAEDNMKVVVALEGSDANGRPISSTMEIEVRTSTGTRAAWLSGGG